MSAEHYLPGECVVRMRGENYVVIIVTGAIELLIDKPPGELEPPGFVRSYGRHDSVAQSPMAATVVERHLGALDGPAAPISNRSLHLPRRRQANQRGPRPLAQAVGRLRRRETLEKPFRPRVADLRQDSNRSVEPKGVGAPRQRIAVLRDELYQTDADLG